MRTIHRILLRTKCGCMKSIPTDFYEPPYKKYRYWYEIITKPNGVLSDDSSVDAATQTQERREFIPSLESETYSLGNKICVNWYYDEN